VLRKRLSVLVGAAVMVLSMFAASAPVFAQELGPGATDLNPGKTEASDSWHTPPPTLKPGAVRRDSTANEKNPETETSRDKLVAGSSP
jgi:hypothetical protein